MAEPRGAWARPRPSASRTPQPRSSNASPAPAASAAPSKPGVSPAPTSAPPVNVWATRAAAQKATPAPAPATGKKEESAPAAAAGGQEKHVPLNGFNHVEVKQFLSREKGSVYKTDKSGNASGGKPGSMANGQSFFNLLNKQVTALQAK
ncbi:hypothetical protein D6C78_00460 [Aureobasidium pullulans]|uniref:Uncharacterized protein n=1 Tax=Aureobasidium pullulans TaxID=5580 RepID=A0A4T0C6V5_AURPU|nr:hypothetical protein D6C78_00460 [Aureobasidium pullulans]